MNENTEESYGKLNLVNYCEHLVPKHEWIKIQIFVNRKIIFVLSFKCIQFLHLFTYSGCFISLEQLIVTSVY
jgi:hypothetical protein